MRRLYAVFFAVVCLAAAATLRAEEPKKKGKWYDIFRGPPTIAAQEQQLRREEFELRKQLLLQQSTQQDTQFEMALSLIDELEAQVKTNRRALIAAMRWLESIETSYKEHSSHSANPEWRWDQQTHQWRKPETLEELREKYQLLSPSPPATPGLNKAERSSPMPTTCNWAGHQFDIYDPDDTKWNEVGGVYIFAGISEHSPTGSTWKAYYIGETQDFSERLPGHEQWATARQHGATDIHAMSVTDTQERRALEKMLIQRFDPPLNQEYR